MTYILLHKKHGTQDWILAKEGTKEEVQDYLDAVGCNVLSDFRIIEGHDMPLEPKALPRRVIFFLQR